MSGGYFDYQQCRINDIIDDIERYLENDEAPNQYAFNDETLALMKEGVECLRKAHVYAHRIDWLLSGDDSEDSFKRRLKEDMDKLKNR